MGTAQTPYHREVSRGVSLPPPSSSMIPHGTFLRAREALAPDMLGACQQGLTLLDLINPVSAACGALSILRAADWPRIRRCEL